MVVDVVQQHPEVEVHIQRHEDIIQIVIIQQLVEAEVEITRVVVVTLTIMIIITEIQHHLLIIRIIVNQIIGQ